jgi:hypothetical protein
MKALISVFFAVSSGFSAISTVQVPYILDEEETPIVAHVDDNNAALQDKINQLIDSLNLYLGGGLKAFRLSSVADLNLTLDSDNNQTNRKLSVTNNGAADTLFKVDENGRLIRVYGNFRVDSQATIAGGVSVNGNVSGVDSLKFSAGGSKYIDFGEFAGSIRGDFSNGGQIIHTSNHHVFYGPIEPSDGGEMGGAFSFTGTLTAAAFYATGVTRNVASFGGEADTIVLDSTYHFLFTTSGTRNYRLPDAGDATGREYVFRAFSGAEIRIKGNSDIMAEQNFAASGTFVLPHVVAITGSVDGYWVGVTLVSDGSKWVATSSVMGETP